MSLEHKCHEYFLELTRTNHNQPIRICNIWIIFIRILFGITISLELKYHGSFLEIVIIKVKREHTLMRLINSSATYLFVA